MNVSVYEDMTTLPGRLREWLEKAGARDFLLGWRWMQAFYALELEIGARPRLYCADVRGHPVAVLPMQTPAARGGSAHRHRLKLGDSLSAAISFQTCEYAPILCADGASAEQGLRACFEYMARVEGRWSWINLNALERESPSFPAILASAKGAGFVALTYPHFPTRYEHYRHDDFSDYIAERAPEDRKQFQNYERKWRKLQREAQATFQYLCRPQDDIHRAIEAYLAVHERSWKVPDRSPDFVPRILVEAHAAGVLRMGILEVDGRPVAVEVAIVRPGGATMLKTAYDQAMRERSVGAIVILLTIKKLVAADRVSEIDFGRDDEPYKQLWMPRRRLKWGIVAFDPRRPGGLLGLTDEARERTFRWARSGVRSVLSGLQRKR